MCMIGDILSFQITESGFAICLNGFFKVVQRAHVMNVIGLYNTILSIVYFKAQDRG